MKYLGTIFVSLLLVFTVALPAYADDGNKNGKGGSAPDAAIVLMLPAAGAAAVGARAWLRRGKQHK
ncbi:MAG TPA: hypothetical protein VK009_06005 [Chloroflexota bacterium]|nr:hypothetical protein [Chloroflexota bacterium]